MDLKRFQKWLHEMDFTYHLIFLIVAFISFLAIWYTVDIKHWLTAWKFTLIVTPILYVVRWILLRKFWTNSKHKKNCPHCGGALK